jgi:hypothetical protein
VNGPRVDLRPHDDRETLLLLDCARGTIDPATADRIRARVTEGLNWNRLLALAQRHGLAPLLYAHLSQICGASVPGEPLAFLRDYAQRNTAFVVMLTGELVRLLKILEANGITAIPYKGPAIALKLYGSVARRQFGDLDILVRQRDVWEAGRLIEAEGYEPVFTLPGTMRARLLSHWYVRTFHRETSRTLLELHWDIAERYWAIRFDADAMWRRLEPMELPGATAFVPCAEDLLLMLCVHGVRHRSDKLEGIASIAELVRSTPQLDWERVGVSWSSACCWPTVSSTCLCRRRRQRPSVRQRCSTWRERPCGTSRPTTRLRTRGGGRCRFSWGSRTAAPTRRGIGRAP